MQTKVKKNTLLGYELEVSWQENLEEKREKMKKVRQAVVAFADDTTWIANSKEQLKEIIKIAEDFFKINDIQINLSKSRLITINAKSNIEECKVIVDKQEVYTTKEKEAVRFLEIWIGQKIDKKQIVAMTKQVARLFTNIIKKKIDSASQVLYINNVCLIPKLYTLEHLLNQR